MENTKVRKKEGGKKQEARRKEELKRAECGDRHCPFHGDIRVRGQMLVGKVVSAKAKRTVIVARPRTKYLFKYRRYTRVGSRIPAHNPPCMDAKEGDIVRIGECRKISRTKAWTICEIIARAE